MLQCPNPNCQTANAESNRFCTQCHLPLPKRYLWGVGAARFKDGALIGDRYRYLGSSIFLDLQPGTAAELTALPPEARPYLRLIQYRLHLPQVYGWVESKANGDPLLLLQDGAIYRPSIYTDAAPGGTTADGQPKPLPRLADLWGNASPWRRLTWLWQMAQLWQPFSQEQVNATLLAPDMLRGEGPLVRLLALQPNVSQKSKPSLAQLGHLWQGWIVFRDPDSRFLMALCQQLIDGTIQSASALAGALDTAIAQLASDRAQSIQLTTQTDQGPSRSRNEDACFPASATMHAYRHGKASAGSEGSLSAATDEEDDEPVVIVCDGIGGHQGGDVASQLAIHSICDHLIDQSDIREGGPLKTFQHLSEALYDANDLISQRNDSEQRRDRQRMGTTVVMALVDDYDCYISHVGDSRAYWITRWGCHQITLDDDVASREVRLGYTTHADAVLRPGAGSLVQALGMSHSTSLYPAVQRLILDGEGLLLLCSDGLSDNDLVETFWPEILLPVLSGETDLATARQALVDTANTQNGYDNVTIGLLRWQVVPPPAAAAKALALQVPSIPAEGDQSTRLQAGDGAELPTTPELARSARSDAPADRDAEPSMMPLKLNVDLRRPALAPLIIGIILLLGVGGLLAYAFVPGVGNRLARVSSIARERSTPNPSVDSAPVGTSDRIPLRPGVVFQIGVSPDGVAAPLPAYGEPVSGLPGAADPAQPGVTIDDATEAPAADSEPTSAPVGYLFPGATAQVLGRSEFSQAVWWVEVKACQNAEVSSSPVGPPLLPGQSAWVLESTLSTLGRIPGREPACPEISEPTPSAAQNLETPPSVPQGDTVQ